nr:nucleotide-binding alpha-beta plait domain-containing protein [Tanacetum cinerariifolium]
MKHHPSFARKGPEVSRVSFNSTNNKAAGDKGYAKTFVNVMKDNSMEKDLSFVIVLDDDCLNTKELNTSLLGRVKEFASFSNLKKIPEFLEESEEDVFSDEGISNKMNDGGEVPDIDEVPETDFEETDGLKVGQSDDPFGIYSLLNKKKSAAPKDGNDEDQRPKFPPGFTPDMISQEAETNGIRPRASKIANSDSIGPGRFKKSVAPCNGGSILSLMVEVVRVGQTVGYKIEGCVNNITEIIESQGAAEGYR